MNLKNKFSQSTHEFIQDSVDALLEKGTSAFTLDEFVTKFYQLEPEYAQKREGAKRMGEQITSIDATFLEWARGSVPRSYLQRCPAPAQLEEGILASFARGMLGYLSERSDKNEIEFDTRLMGLLKFYCSNSSYDFKHFEWLSKLNEKLTQAKEEAKRETKSKSRGEQYATINNKMHKVLLEEPPSHNFAKSLLDFLGKENSEPVNGTAYRNLQVEDSISTIVQTLTTVDLNRMLGYFEPKLTPEEKYQVYRAFFREVIPQKEFCVKSLNNKEKLTKQLRTIERTYPDILPGKISAGILNEAQVLTLAYTLIGAEKYRQLGEEMLRELSEGLVTTNYYLEERGFGMTQFEEFITDKSISTFSNYLREKLGTLDPDLELRVRVIPEACHKSLIKKISDGERGVNSRDVESGMYVGGGLYTENKKVTVNELLGWIDDQENPEFFWFRSEDNQIVSSWEEIDLLYAGNNVHGVTVLPVKVLHQDK